MPRQLRIATRESPLALWQARHVEQLLGDDVDVVLVPMTTTGDQKADVPISTLGGKGVFVKEVQAAVLNDRADLAVHSAKDLPALTPPELMIAAVPERGDPRDALVGCRLVDLPDGATVATGSHRRRVQLAALRPDLRFAELRGNIATRLAKAAGFDAIVMAAVALERLDEAPDIVDALSVEQMIPQVGQGALAVEVRSDDDECVELLRAINHAASERRLVSERAFLAELGGDCDMPAGAYATLDGDRVTVTGVLARDLDAPTARAAETGTDAAAVGAAVARALSGL